MVVVFAAGVLPGLELVFLFSVFLSLRGLRPRFGTDGLVGCRAGLGIAEICPCFRAASVESAFLTRSLNVHESSIWGTMVVSM